MSVLVAKADGTTEPFDSSKLLASLMRAGASDVVAEEITKDVRKELYNGISTSQIYHKAFAQLRDLRRGAAARYSLKRAIQEFGPSGFPFEEYLADLFRAEGYKAQTDQIVQGGCVEHEVDVILTKDRTKTYVEAKFHNNPGYKTDLKTVLYVQARMEDLQKTSKNGVLRGMVVTNTKFTAQAVRYASCVGLELLSWEYPDKQDLHERIDMAKLYPITALTSLSRNEKMALLQKKMVLCTQLPRDTRSLARIGIRGQRAQAVIEEAGALCVPGKDI
jgi:HJR/Mrr/RecB family endonuclease